MRQYKVICSVGPILSILAAAQPAWPDTAPGRQESASGIRHSFLVTGTTTAALFDEDSNVVWEVEGYSRDGYVLENGNVLLSTGNEAREYKAGTHDVVPIESNHRWTRMDSDGLIATATELRNQR